MLSPISSVEREHLTAARQVISHMWNWSLEDPGREMVTQPG